ncbi:MAG: nucleotidyltransferase domain-containing protein [Bacteroidota bacterium]|nr:nucleotidyltransferase domain-containing protein [Bacteroidota bacterium]
MDRRKQIIKWLKDILDANLKGVSFRAFIFGSQANKLVLSRSDIDLGIIADDKITIQQMAKIQADIEALPMLYNIDLVNFSEVDEQFKSISLKNVESL